MTAIKVKTASGWQDLSVAVPGSVAIEPWTTVASIGGFASGWSAHASSAPVFRKTPDGRVQLRGSVVTTGFGFGAAVLTLPTGYRPVVQFNFIALFWDAAAVSAYSGVLCSVSTAGVLTIVGNIEGGTASGASGCILYLDGVEFPTDQASFPTGPSGADTAPRVSGALPSPMYDGQEIVYVADAAAGVLWRLRYNAASASAYKWEFVGGSPLVDEQIADENGSMNASTWGGVSGNDPQLAVPLAGDYDAQMHAKLINNTSACSFHAGFRVGAVDPVILVSATAQSQAATATNAAVSFRRRLAGVAAATTISHRYWHNGTNPSTITRGAAQLAVWPVRVG